ncbi:MAG: HXXEE domain-containing protein [Stappia sp.]|uniref:HXXEE domain-containing protein n=1 Tax=Stappia sp. TaxID=1870903 RepID=UPI000C4B59D9|nr:HXXEE domain-containing protein [Stappia sp.]MAA99166.1 HXXEE domain-containing protein [Stappia sp.]MBM19376.1 HXXEE domain-containing protein [Stappia sp.]
MKATVSRLQANWVYGGALVGVCLLVLSPLLTAGWPLGERLVWLVLPVYMLHQLEEHDGDRFRLFVNATIGGGREALSVRDVFVINVFGVWGVMVVTLWLMRAVAPDWGLVGIYLVLVNAVLHFVQALVMRRVNPGLWTALVLFLPLGVWGLAEIGPGATPAAHTVSLAAVVVLHVAIVVNVRRRLARA